MFIDFILEIEEERKTSIGYLPYSPQLGTEPADLGPNQKWNQQPFGVENDAQPTAPHSHAPHSKFLRHLSV